MKSILIVSSDYRIGQLLSRFSQILLPGVNILRSEDCASAVAVAMRLQPDLIILDPQNESLPLAEVATHLRAAAPQAPLISTGSAGPDGHPLWAAGLIDGWLPRPTPLWALSSVIERVMTHRQPENWAPAAKDWLRLPAQPTLSSHYA